MSNNDTILEQEFLKNYDSNSFPKPSFTVDVLLFSLSNEEQENYRKLNKKHFSILLTKRTEHPFKGFWSLPGGFIELQESIDNSVQRILSRETGLDDIYTEQLYTFGDVNRDPRTRVISTAYMALMDKSELNKPLNKKAKWFDIKIFEDDKIFDCTLSNGDETLGFTAQKHKNGEYKINKSQNLAFDHALFIITGLMRLRNKVEYTDIAFNVLPELFTLTELQHVYETILGKKLLAPAFRRIIAKQVSKTNNMRIGAGHRPAVLFKKK